MFNKSIIFNFYLGRCEVGSLDMSALNDDRQIIVALFCPRLEHQGSYVLDRWESQTSVRRHQQVLQSRIGLKLIIDLLSIELLILDEKVYRQSLDGDFGSGRGVKQEADVHHYSN